MPREHSPVPQNEKPTTGNIATAVLERSTDSLDNSSPVVSEEAPKSSSFMGRMRGLGEKVKSVVSHSPVPTKEQPETLPQSASGTPALVGISSSNVIVAAEKMLQEPTSAQFGTEEKVDAPKSPGEFDITIASVKAHGGKDIVENSAARAAQEHMQKRVSGWLEGADIRKGRSEEDYDSMGRARRFFAKAKDTAETAVDLSKATGKEMAHHPAKFTSRIYEGSIIQGAVRAKEIRNSMAQEVGLSLNDVSKPLQKLIHQAAQDKLREDRSAKNALGRARIGVKDFVGRAIADRTEIEQVERDVVERMREALLTPAGRDETKKAFLNSPLMQAYKEELSGQTAAHESMVKSHAVREALGEVDALQELSFTPTTQENKKLSAESRKKAEFIDGLQELTMDAIAGNFSGPEAQVKVIDLLHEVGMKNDLSAQATNIQSIVEKIAQTIRSADSHIEGSDTIEKVMNFFVDKQVRVQSGEMIDETAAEIHTRRTHVTDKAIERFKEHGAAEDLVGDTALARTDLLDATKKEAVYAALGALGGYALSRAISKGARIITAPAMGAGAFGVAAARAAVRSGHNAEIGLAVAQTNAAHGQEVGGEQGKVATIGMQEIGSTTVELVTTLDAIKGQEHPGQEVLGKALGLIAAVDGRNKAGDEAGHSLWKTDATGDFHEDKVIMDTVRSEVMAHIKNKASLPEVKALATHLGIEVQDSADKDAYLLAIRQTLGNAVQANIQTGEAINERLATALSGQEAAKGETVKDAKEAAAKLKLNAQVKAGVIAAGIGAGFFGSAVAEHVLSHEVLDAVASGGTGHDVSEREHIQTVSYDQPLQTGHAGGNGDVVPAKVMNVEGKHGLLAQYDTKIDHVEFAHGAIEQGLHTDLVEHGHTLRIEQELDGKDVTHIAFQTVGKNGEIKTVLVPVTGRDGKGKAYVDLPLNDTSTANARIELANGQKVETSTLTSLFVNKEALHEYIKHDLPKGTLHKGDGDIATAVYPDGPKIWRDTSTSAVHVKVHNRETYIKFLSGAQGSDNMSDHVKISELNEPTPLQVGNVDIEPGKLGNLSITSEGITLNGNPIPPAELAEFKTTLLDHLRFVNQSGVQVTPDIIINKNGTLSVVDATTREPLITDAQVTTTPGNHQELVWNALSIHQKTENDVTTITFDENEPYLRTGHVDLTNVIEEFEGRLDINPKVSTRLGSFEVQGLSSKGLMLGNIVLVPKKDMGIVSGVLDHMHFENSQGKTIVPEAVYDPKNGGFTIIDSTDPNHTPLLTGVNFTIKNGHPDLYWDAQKITTHVDPRNGTVTFKIDESNTQLGQNNSGHGNLELTEITIPTEGMENGKPLIQTAITELVTVDATTHKTTIFGLGEAHLESDGSLFDEKNNISIDAATVERYQTVLSQITIHDASGMPVQGAHFKYANDAFNLVDADGNEKAQLFFDPNNNNQLDWDGEGTFSGNTFILGDKAEFGSLNVSQLVQTKEFFMGVSPKDVTIVTPGGQTLDFTDVTLTPQGELVDANGNRVFSPSQISALLTTLTSNDIPHNVGIRFQYNENGGWAVSPNNSDLVIEIVDGTRIEHDGQEGKLIFQNNEVVFQSSNESGAPGGSIGNPQEGRFDQFLSAAEAGAIAGSMGGAVAGATHPGDKLWRRVGSGAKAAVIGGGVGAVAAGGAMVSLGIGAGAALASEVYPIGVIGRREVQHMKKSLVDRRLYGIFSDSAADERRRTNAANEYLDEREISQGGDNVDAIDLATVVYKGLVDTKSPLIAPFAYTRLTPENANDIDAVVRGLVTYINAGVTANGKPNELQVTNRTVRILSRLMDSKDVMESSYAQRIKEYKAADAIKKQEILERLFSRLIGIKSVGARINVGSPYDPVVRSAEPGISEPAEESSLKWDESEK